MCCVQKSLKGSSLHTLSLVARLLEKTEEKNPSVCNADLKTIFRHLKFKHDNMLNTQCARLVDVMSRRWNGVKSRDEFVARFSADKATRLDVASRSKHSLGV